MSTSGSPTDIPRCLRHVRSAPNNGLKSDIAASRFRAINRHRAIGRLHRLYLSRPPSLVEPRLKRTVEAQEGAPAFAGDGLHPVVFLAQRSLRSEIDIH